LEESSRRGMKAASEASKVTFLGIIFDRTGDKCEVKGRGEQPA